ncbi:MAG TPA: FlgD immunoglobulin-like domain containing protein, partial [Candidatus Edwardsbacteria bacterium]|nr:FlgD immunoglobulin-like domain containing protein [Candidatus Edwardsbacteria bacterium]
AYEYLAPARPFAKTLNTAAGQSRSLWDSSGTWTNYYHYGLCQAAVVSYSSYGKKGAKEVGRYEVWRDAGSGYSWLADDYDLAYVDYAAANGSTYGYQVRAVYPRTSLPDTFSAFTSPASVTTAVTGAPRVAANHYFLGAVSPNPMNSQAAISFGLAAAGRVSIEVYNVAGQRVQALVDGDLAAGPHTITWNGRNEAGRRAAAGLYLYRMRAGGFSATRRLLVVK